MNLDQSPVENRGILKQVSSLQVVELSCKSEYALLALIALADQFELGEPLQIRQISQDQNIPDRYLEQVLSLLRKAELVRSQRGAKGGYFLAREPWNVTVLEVLTCIEGDNLAPVFKRSPQDSIEKTIVHRLWQDARQAVSQVLLQCTLQDLCDQRDTQQQSELMYYI